MTGCGAEFYLSTAHSVLCTNPTGHKGAHAWHRDAHGTHVTVVWWPIKPQRRKASA